MSVQIFLQGQLHGIEEFLLAEAHRSEWESGGAAGETLFVGRSRWVGLLSEVLPRALLAELGLSQVLLGSSGGGQFLVVLPGEVREAADEFLAAAAEEIRRLSSGFLSLAWGATENLGDWAVVRRRLAAEMLRLQQAPAVDAPDDLFDPFDEPPPADTEGYFSQVMGVKLQDAKVIGWSPDSPARLLPEPGKHTWPLVDSAEAIHLARHSAPGDDPEKLCPATPAELAGRAQGHKVWGVLRGDVDNFGLRVRRLTTIEEHVQISMLYKQFFAGELEVLCSMADFWQKVTIVYSGGNDFGVFGAWDALIPLAREIQRLFHRFNEENLKDIPGAEGKTISMALAIAPEHDTPLAEVYEEAGRKLQIAKSTDKDCIHLFGHTVEWRHLAHAADLQETLGRLAKLLGGSSYLLSDMVRFYKSPEGVTGRPEAGRFHRPWRFHRHLSLLGGGVREREFQKLRSRLVVELTGKSATQATLRPAGRVALEWARLLAEA